MAFSLIVELVDGKKRGGKKKQGGGRRRRSSTPQMIDDNPVSSRQPSQWTQHQTPGARRSYNVHTSTMNTKDEDRSMKLMHD
ncbi:uncharacterized protein LOC144744634 isoform X3 [Ciona intestinalis]